MEKKDERFVGALCDRFARVDADVGFSGGGGGGASGGSDGDAAVDAPAE